MKKIILSEEQDKLIQNKLNEMLNPNLGNNFSLNANVTKKDGQPVSSNEIPQLLNSMDKAQDQTGLTTNAKVNIGNDGDTETLSLSSNNPSRTTIKESILITKKQLNEARLKKLKSNSQVIKVENFLK